jgi:cell division protease FtsH
MPSIKINKQKGGWLKLLNVFLTYFVITVTIVFLVSYLSGFGGFNNENEENKLISISQAIELVKKGEVQKITVNDNELTVALKNGEEKTAHKEIGVSIFEVFKDANAIDNLNQVEVTVDQPIISDFVGLIISNLLPILIMIIFFVFLFRQAGKSAGGVFDFGKSTAKIFNRNQQKFTFDDAAGVAEAKKELEEVVDFLKHPEKYRKLGARIPKGVLLVGPAGTGKTLLAKAVANEAEVPFFSMAGSEFMEMLVGVGASRVRDLFRTAKASSPALIFIDEVESIGRSRGHSVVTSHGEQEQTLNQILVEMDGFNPNDNVIILAATNRPDLLDPALTRPGRFDRMVVLQLPDIEGRKEIVRIHVRNKPIAADVSVDRLAQRTVGFSGADIENMLNEAAILAAANGKTEIGVKEIDESITKVKLGRERHRIQSDDDKRMTAYHEAGHAIVAKRLPGMDIVHRVSIVSRGMALGFTEINPEEDRSHQTKVDLINQITALLGGRAAEEIIFSDMTVGAGSDLERASSLAYRMVTDYGMSDLGPISFSNKFTQDPAVDPGMGGPRYSEDMAARIDNEVKRIIDHAYVRAKEILRKEKDILDKLVDVLIVHETIEKEEFDKLVEELSNENAK